jgi:hypothetical protein
MIIDCFPDPVHLFCSEKAMEVQREKIVLFVPARRWSVDSEISALLSEPS